MAVDWLEDVKKYEPHADEAAVAGIVRHCGIALRNRDSSLVSFTDPAETDRVRNNFLKKKLARTEPDGVLDQAIAAVGERMKGDRTKNRVTVYYLLAEHFGQLALFHGKAKTGGAGTSDAPAGNGGSGSAASAELAAGAGALGLAGAGAAAAEATVTPPAPPPPAVPPASAATGATSGGSYGGASASGGSGSAQGFADVPQGGGGSRWWLWALLAILALLILFFLLRSCQQQPAATGSFNATEANLSDVDTTGTGNDMLANAGGADTGDLNSNAGTTAVVPPSAPAGAGVTETTSNGAPALNVYFDKGKSDVTADFSAAATKLTAYLSAHPGATLAVSGYNDPSGNAAVNAQISKERAQHVAAALKAAGVPDSAVALVKPSDTTIASTDPNAARRVEVTVKQ